MGRRSAEEDDLEGRFFRRPEQVGFGVGIGVDRRVASLGLVVDGARDLDEAPGEGRVAVGDLADDVVGAQAVGPLARRRGELQCRQRRQAFAKGRHGRDQAGQQHGGQHGHACSPSGRGRAYHPASLRGFTQRDKD